MERKNELLLRVYLIFFAFVLFSGLIITKVVKTTLLDGEKWRSQGQKNIKWVEVAGERGNIYDAKGNLLATSLPYFDIRIDLLTSSDANFNSHIDGLSEKLAKHFGKTQSEWKATLTQERKKGKSGNSSSARYYPLMNKVTKDELDLLMTFPLFNLGKYKGGLIYERKTRRERPFRELAQRTIGEDRRNAEKVGLERTYDKILSGDAEQRLMRRLPGDIWLPVYDPSVMIEERGSDIVTTLDMHIQDVAHNELEKVLTKNKAQKGVAIVMEVETGAIKALVNLRSSSVGGYQEEYNDCVGSLSEPGSTFKLMSAVALMDRGAVDLDTEVSMFGGKKKFYKDVMYDSEQHGIIAGTFQEAFKISSNVGIAYATYQHYGKNIDGWKSFYSDLHKLGVMEESGIEIFGEPAPKFKNPSERKKNDPLNWSGTTVPWMSHGYELEMTPLQVLNFYNAVANDGKMMKPYLVTEVMGENGERTEFKPKVLKKQIAKPATILKAQDLLQAVAESGTARKLKVEGLTFAGKTGTTKLRYWENDGSNYNASFVGYFPAEQPKYSVIVVVYEPEGHDYYGAKVAGPVFQGIMQRLTSYQNVLSPESDKREIAFAKVNTGYKPDLKRVLEFIGMKYNDEGEGKWAEMSGKNGKLELSSIKQDKKRLPDVRGKGLRDAIFILEEAGVSVEVDGYGKVYKQTVVSRDGSKKKSVKIYLK